MVAPIAAVAARGAAAGGAAARAPAAPTPRSAPRSEPTGGRDAGQRPGASRPQRPQTYEEQEQQRRTDKESVRIDNLMVIAMLSLAVVFDATQFFLSFLHVVPVVGNAIALVLTGYIGVVASWMIFPLWFKLLHVHFLKGSQAGLKVAALGVPAVAEFVTFINALPLIVAGVGVNIAITRFEDVFGDFSEIAAELAKAKNPTEKARMQVAMGQAFMSGRRYRPEQEGQPEKKPANSAGAPARAFDIANPAVYDYQNQEQEQRQGGGGQASAIAAPILALGRASAGGKETFPYREMRRAATKADDLQSGRESWPEAVGAAATPWDTRTKGEKEVAKAAALKRRQDAIEATS